MDAFERAMLMAEEVNSDETWTRLEKYESMEYFSESDVEINLNERTIGDVSGNVSTIGEDNSQYIQFIMDRYADGVDLTTMLIQVQYRLENGQESVSGPVNAYASESRIRFGWPISRIATQEEQTIQFIVFCTGNRQDGEPYVLKTKPIKYKIEFTLNNGGTIIAPDEDWFLQFENVMNEKLNQVAGLTEDAIDSAAGAKESEQKAAQSASTASTLAGQVQSNTAQAKASADAAKVSEQNAKASEDAARVYAGNASAVANVQIGTSDTAGLLRGGDIHVDESGALKMITTTTETTMPNSYDGRLLVKEIGGVCEQNTTSGSQLLPPLKNTEQTLYGVTAKMTNGYVVFNGTNTHEHGVDFYVFGNSGTYEETGLSAGEYTVSLAAQSDYITFYIVKSNGSILVSLNNANNSNTFTVEDGETYRVFYRISVGSTLSNVAVKVMLNKGTTALPWEPYTGGIASPNPSYPQEIKKSVVSEIRTHGKNFIPNVLQNTTINGITATVNSDKSITFNGTANGTADFYLFGGISDNGNYIKIPKGSKILNATGGGGLVAREKTRGALTGFNTIQRTLNESDCYFYGVFIRFVSDKTANNETAYPMISVDGGEYEPYTESVVTLSNPIDLYGYGGVQDVIEGGKIKRKYLKIINLKDYIQYAYVENNYYVVDVSPFRSDKTICTHFRYGGYGSYNGNVGYYFGIGGSSTQLRFSKYGFNSVNDFKEFVTNNDVKVICFLKTPADEALPLADQIALNILSTYDGITYIEFDSEIKPTFKGKYGTSEVGGYTLEALLTARNNEMRIAAMETADQAVE